MSMEDANEVYEPIDLLEDLRALFRPSPYAYGSFDSPTKNGFIALAKAGKNTWNEWRQNHPGESPDFSDTVFEEDADFSGYIFSMQRHQSTVDFSRTKFLKKTTFRGAKFHGDADFTDAVFCMESDFSQCLFGESVNFNRTIFVGFAGFMHTSFGVKTEFINSEFRNSCSFRACRFGAYSSFFRTKFESKTIFFGAEFGISCVFLGATFSGNADFRHTKYRGDCEFSAENREDTPLAAKVFYGIDFSGSIFEGNVDFSSREFRSRSNFGRAQIPDGRIAWNKHSMSSATKTFFLGIPIFHQCKLNQDTSFDDTEFETSSSPEAARAFRTLKLAMEQIKATREEQRFFRLEMKAEHPSLPWGKRCISTLYSLFSDYGFSLWRPIVWLLALSLLFGTGYGLLANACAADGECAKVAWDANTGSSADRTSAVIKYTLASVSPVPGLDRMQTELRAPLFGHHGWVPITALMLEILHKIIALVMVFLFALALRNLFKMKS